MYKDFDAETLRDLIDSEVVKTSVKNIVYTEVNDIPGMPEFGCRTRSMVFEQMDPFTMNTMQTLISNSLRRYEDRIDNVEVQVDSEPAQNKVICNVSYSIKQINNQEKVSIRLK